MWLFIVNPAAGAGQLGRRWPATERLLQTYGVAFDVVFTERKHHAMQLAAAAIANGCRHLAAVGGDGTAHEVVNGIFTQTACPPEAVTFTLLPVGTGNDWVKTHRIPKNTRRWIRFLQQGKTSFQDIGQVTYRAGGQVQTRHFLNVAGLSYDAFVVKKSEAHPRLLSNRLFYLWLLVRCLFQFSIPRLRITHDDRVTEGPLYTVNAGICRYSGGGMQLTPHALPADGLLALTIARRIPKWMVVFITPLFYLGKIKWHPAVSLFQVKHILVETLDNEPLLVEADGEFLGGGPVAITVAAGRLRILAV